MLLRIKNEAKQQRNGEWINDMNYMNGDDATDDDNATYFDDNATYFNSFGVEHIPEEIRAFISNKNVIKIIYRIKENESILC